MIHVINIPFDPPYYIITKSIEEQKKLIDFFLKIGAKNPYYFCGSGSRIHHTPFYYGLDPNWNINYLSEDEWHRAYKANSYKYKFVEEILNYNPFKTIDYLKSVGGLVTPTKTFGTQQEVNIQNMIDSFKKELELYRKEFEKFIPYQLCPKCEGTRTSTTWNMAYKTTGGPLSKIEPCIICGGTGIIPMHKEQQYGYSCK